MTEKELEQWAYAKAKSAGMLLLKQTSQTGIPDRILMTPKAFCFIEFKRSDGKGRLSPSQYVTHKRLRERGYTVHVVDSKEQFINIINEVQTA